MQTFYVEVFGMKPGRRYSNPEVNPWTQAAAEKVLAHVVSELGLKPAPTIRWFKATSQPNSYGNRQTFTDRPGELGRVYPDDLSAVWLNADMFAAKAAYVCSHELGHLCQLRNHEPADEVEASEFARVVVDGHFPEWTLPPGCYDGDRLYFVAKRKKAQ